MAEKYCMDCAHHALSYQDEPCKECLHDWAVGHGTTKWVDRYATVDEEKPWRPSVGDRVRLMSTKGVTVSRELIDEVGTVVDMSSYTDDDGIASYYGVKFDKKLYEGDDFVWGVYLSQIAPVEQEDPMDDVDTEQAELDESIGLLLEGIEEDLYNAIENGVDRITFSVDLSNWYK